MLASEDASYSSVGSSDAGGYSTCSVSGSQVSAAGYSFGGSSDSVGSAPSGAPDSAFDIYDPSSCCGATVARSLSFPFCGCCGK